MYDYGATIRKDALNQVFKGEYPLFSAILVRLIMPPKFGGIILFIVFLQTTHKTNQKYNEKDHVINRSHPMHGTYYAFMGRQ